MSILHQVRFLVIFVLKWERGAESPMRLMRTENRPFMTWHLCRYGLTFTPQGRSCSWSTNNWQHRFVSMHLDLNVDVSQAFWLDLCRACRVRCWLVQSFLPLPKMSLQGSRNAPPIWKQQPSASSNAEAVESLLCTKNSTWNYESHIWKCEATKSLL